MFVTPVLSFSHLVPSLPTMLHKQRQSAGGRATPVIVTAFISNYFFQHIVHNHHWRDVDEKEEKKLDLINDLSLQFNTQMKQV